jgi:hypothetical protein
MTKMLALKILAITKLELVSTVDFLVPIIINAQWRVAITQKVVNTPQKTAMTTIFAQSTLAITTRAVSILQLFVTTTMLAQRTIAPRESAYLNQSNFLLQKTNVKFLHVAQRQEFTPMKRIVMIAIHALWTDAIPGQENAFTREKIATITTNAPMTFVLQLLELALTLQSFVPITILAQRTPAILNWVVLTVLSMIWLILLKTTNATLILAIAVPEIS